MSTTTESAVAFERAVGPVLEILLPDKAIEILSYRPDSALQDRIDELAEKSTEGTLSEEELAAYEGYVRANKFIAILQRQARRRLQNC